MSTSRFQRSDAAAEDLACHDCETRRLRHARLFAMLGRLGGGAVVGRLKRRLSWFARGLTGRKAANLLTAGADMLARRERVRARPVFLRIDISPLCNLRCTICVHAAPDGNPDLAKQHFDAAQMMSVEQFASIVEQVKDHATGVSLYYLGDPLVHPDVDTMCRIAHDAGLNVHYSTNFSFVLPEQRIRSIVDCGLTHLTVCVDGLSQHKYGLTRVGGRIALVLENLRRACAYRRACGRRYPIVEVQYIKYQHNLDELPAARRMFAQLGVDQVHELWGGLHNYTDRDPEHYHVFGPRRARAVPLCHWPYFFMQIKYNGDVIPCCCFRLGHQYSHRDDPRVFGNVLTGSVADVWNSAAYQQCRRLACRPAAAGDEARENFCYACPRLYHTDYAKRTCRWARDYTFDDLYTLDERGRPHRRPETRPAGQPVSC